MDYRFYFTNRALTDLSEIVGRIARDDDEVASRFGEALLDHVDLFAVYPQMGNTIRRNSRVRKLVHSRILVYHRIDDDRRSVEVLHLRHGSRKRPKF